MPEGRNRRYYFGRLFGTRSGDKGGCANLGVWAKNGEAYRFLYHYLSVERLKVLLPDTAEYTIDRYELPNIRALNFYIHGILGDGIAAAIRSDGQAKSLGEYLRAKIIEVPMILTSSLDGSGSGDISNSVQFPGTRREE